MPEPVSRSDDLRDLAVACRVGDLDGCERLAERAQTELLRCAYLLTGDSGAAAALVDATLLAVIGDLFTGGSEDDLRPRLIIELGRRYLADVAQGGHIATLGSSDRYYVEDERSRTLAALALLGAPARLTLVLVDFAGLPLDVAKALTAVPRTDLTERLAVARQRVRDAAGVGHEEGARRALAQAALTAPRDDRWPYVAEAVAERRRRAHRRGRRLTLAAAVGVLVLLLSLATILLRDESPAADGERLPATPDQQAAVHDLPQPTSDQPVVDPAALQPTRGPLPLGGGAPTDDLASVPALLLVQTGAGVGTLPGGAEDVTPAIFDAPLPKISPDGTQLFFVRTERVERGLRSTVVATDAATLTPRWETEVVVLRELSEGQSWAYTIDLTIAGDRVYVAARSWQTSRPISIIALERSGGTIEGRWTLDFQGPITGLFGLFADPDGTALHLFLLGQWQDYAGVVTYFRFDLPTVGFQEYVHPVGGLQAPEFFFWSARPLPDGSGLYNIDYIDNSRTASVRIFDFATQRLTDIILPVSKAPEDRPLPLEVTASHDGRLLYIIAPMRAEVVIVDLAERAVAHAFPLDLGGYAFHWMHEWDAPLPPAMQSLQLARDGLRLYAVGLPVGGERGTGGIWVIDTAVWRVIDHWLPERPIWTLTLEGNLLYALETSYSPGSQSPAPRRLHLLDALTGRSVVPARSYDELWSAPLSLAALYRQQYGHSPLSAGVRPADPRPVTAAPAAPQVELLEVDAERGRVLVEVRFVRPDNGAPVRPTDPHARYTPPLDLRLTFNGSDGTPLLILPGEVEYGVYHGVAQLPTAGDWDVLVAYTDSAGLWRRLWFPAFVTIEPLSATS